ncbi:hypothetical protein RJ640_003554 [Escallonia rubra]|uniref:GDSL esterase/lipase n=1 Tax=Escallonia rubra TaxID=112253 RepID=A0AA88RB11_9ASTE|nr:hypothetical protein RJ640_003554 [Escallonia rubra]
MVRSQPPQGPQVPCFFIFGDSLVDNGNNNAIITLARANYRPYGIDFPQGTTCRFTNGRTFVDVLVEKLGRYQSNLEIAHWTAAEKRYDSLEVVDYSDSDFAGCSDDSESTRGIFFMTVGCAISWKSVKQTLVTYEEFVAPRKLRLRQCGC